MARHRRDDEPKKRYNLSLRPSSYERLQDAAVAERYSNSELAEIAINAYIDTLEADRGKPFPSRD